MPYNLYMAVEMCLRENRGEELTAREIAWWIIRRFPAECEEKMRHAPYDTEEALAGQIAAEMSRVITKLQSNYPEFTITADPPRKLMLPSVTNQGDAGPPRARNPFPLPRNLMLPSVTNQEGVERQEPPRSNKRTEKDLYPLLAKYLRSLGIYPKHIEDKKSSNRRGSGGNKWLFPDVVGMEHLTAEWQPETNKMLKDEDKIKIWSLEVKLELKRGNVRESFFQAVSNSSWANYGYLVAEKIEDNTMKELRLLCGSHGIGLIKINSGRPTDSQIIIPAREKPKVDWATCDRIVSENRDFREFIKQINSVCGGMDPELLIWLGDR